VTYVVPRSPACYGDPMRVSMFGFPAPHGLVLYCAEQALAGAWTTENVSSQVSMSAAPEV